MKTLENALKILVGVYAIGVFAAGYHNNLVQSASDETLKDLAWRTRCENACLAQSDWDSQFIRDTIPEYPEYLKSRQILRNKIKSLDSDMAAEEKDCNNKKVNPLKSWAYLFE